MRFRRLLVALLATSLLAGLMGGGAAASPIPQPSEDWEFAANLLMKFGIISGDPSGDLRPGDTITRAEMAKILVAAAGHSESARTMAGASAFTDTGGHWSSGWAAVAKNAGWVSGDPGGTFRPDDPVTYGEVLTMLARFVALPPASGSWPENYVRAAEFAGLVPAGMDLRNRAGARADRRSVFVLANAAFMGVQDATGKSTYQRVHDGKAPRLTVGALPAKTLAPTVRIAGSVDENALVAVNGNVVSPHASGAFEYDLRLSVGQNAIVVTALDDAGNETRHQAAVERQNTQPARIDVPATLTVTAGATERLAAVVRDTTGEPMAGAPLQVVVTGGVGTFDPVAGTFTAAPRTGNGRLQLTSGSLQAEVAVRVVPGKLARLAISPAAVNLGGGMLQHFTARGQDAAGNDLGPVSPVWSTEAGKGIIDGNGQFTPTGRGAIRVTATLGDIRGDAVVTAYGAPARLAFAPVGSMAANGSATTAVRVLVQDAEGNTVANHVGRVTLALGAGTAAGFAGAGGTLDPAIRVQTLAAAGGVATFNLVAGTAPGDILLSATAPGLAGMTAMLPVVAQEIHSFAVVADMNQLAADGVSSTKVRVLLQDQTGAPYLGTNTGGWKATFASSDSSVIQITDTAYATTDSAGGAQITAAAQARNGVGHATISVTVMNGSQTRHTAAIPMRAVVVGEPFQLVAGAAASATARQQDGDESMALTFRVQDVNGNQVTRLSSLTGFSLRLTSSDEKYVVTVAPGSSFPVQRSIAPAGVALDATNATISSGQITVRVASSRAQTAHFTLTGSYSGNTLRPAEVDGTFAPGPAASLTLDADPDGNVDGVATGKSATLTATVRDNAQLDLATYPLTVGNPVTTGHFPVKLVRTAGSTTLWPGTQTATSSAGQAIFLVSAGAAVGSDSFRASFAPTETRLVESNTAQVQVAIFGGPFRLALASFPVSATAGGDIAVAVKVQDGQTPPRTVTSDNSTAITLTVRDAAGNVKSTYNGTAVNGTARFKVSDLADAGGYTLAATASGLLPASAPLSITAGPARQLMGALTAPTMAASSGSESTLHVFVADAYGNRRPDDLVLAGNPQVTVSSGHPAIATVAGLTCTNATAVTAAVCKATLRGTPNVGTATLSARMPGLDPWTGEVTTVIVGPPARVELIPPSSATAGVTHTVRVRVNDANGNRVTHSEHRAYVRVTVEGDGYNTGNTTLTTVDGGDNSQLTNWVQTNQGEASFTVMTRRAAEIRYKATLVSGFGSDTAIPGTGTVSGYGNVAAGPATGVFVGLPSPRSIPGDGYAVAMVTAHVTDAYGNRAAIPGTFTFQVTPAFPGAPGGSAYAALQGSGSATQTVAAPDGAAMAVIQSRPATNQGTIAIMATFTPDAPGVILSQNTGTSTPPAGDTAAPLTITPR